jgi:hypothetical protein
MPQPSKATADSVPDEVASAIGDRLGPAAEGSLWLAFIARRGGLALCAPVTEGTQHIDELFLRDLAGLIRTFDVPGVVLVVHRASGRATRADRLLWRELRLRLGESRATRLDLLVV